MLCVCVCVSAYAMCVGDGLIFSTNSITNFPVGKAKNGWKEGVSRSDFSLTSHMMFESFNKVIFLYVRGEIKVMFCRKKKERG